MELCAARLGVWMFGLLACDLASAQSLKIETIEYHDDLSLWVLGQVKRTTTNGIETSRTAYDARALPVSNHVFGKLQQTQGYNADGTLAFAQDGNGNRTTFSDWKRGIPQTVGFADATTQRATVDDNGWIRSLTSEVGAKSCFDYDAMGRMQRVTYPSESQWDACDAATWDLSYTSFAPLTANDWRPPGVAAGQWVHRTIRGAYRKYVYHDALWRPVLTHEFDERDTDGTLRARLFEYDASGRLRFESYPSSQVIPAANGMWSQYDALGRITQFRQDSELGLLTTTTEYLPGFRARVTNPRGIQTNTEYQVFDEPRMDSPTAIAILGNVTGQDIVVTEIERDVFGKPRRISRRDGHDRVRVDRHYVYGAHQQLCKTVEPETGSTLYIHDGAGNLRYESRGLALPDPNNCNIAPNYPSISRTYDVRNRVKTVGFPDGLGNQNWTYTADGLPASVTTWNGANNTLPAINTYQYNRRGLLVGESLEQVGWYTWATGYAYESHGHLMTVRYPTALAVSYFPNALGQPTLVRDGLGQPYASGIQYHPNGAIRQFTYGNNVVHTMTQNLRQLPAWTVQSQGLMHTQSLYDANGNVTDLYDHANGSHYNRHMTYDGLDRLLTAASWGFGGDGWHRLGYNALDNITSWTLDGIKDHAQYLYDASNRLTSIRNTAGATILGLSYDERGNLKNRNGQNYLFDYGNRLREVTGKEHYRYDAHGRRILAWSPTEGNILSLYGSDGKLLYENDRRTLQLREHIHLEGSLLATRETPAAGGSAVVKYQHTDALGSPVAVSDASRVLRRTFYDPFGGTINQPGYGGPGYTGHVQDAATGLTYMQQRYYDPGIGRFLSVDPVTAYSMPGVNFNRFWYANNNPYGFKDPDGRVALPGFVIGVGLELVRQSVTGEIKDTSFKGVAGNFGKALVAGIAGAGGAGVASGVARLTTSLTARAAANGLAGAAIGGASTGANNAIDGKPLTESMGKGALVGGALGAAGSLTGDAVDALKSAANAKAVNAIPLADRNLLEHMKAADPRGSANPNAVGVGSAVSNSVSNSGGLVESCGTQKKC